MNNPRPRARTPGGTSISITGSPGAAIASGDGARAAGHSSQNEAAADTLQRIDRLLAELEQAASRQLDPVLAEDALDEIERAQAEVHHRRPNLESIRLTLGRLAVTVGSAAGLLAKVDEVKDLVTLLVH